MLLSNVAGLCCIYLFLEQLLPISELFKEQYSL